MNRGAWRATVQGVARVRHDLATKQQQPLIHGGFDPRSKSSGPQPLGTRDWFH